MTLGNAIIHDSPVGLSVSCEDYDAEIFGGSDYEYIYTFDRSNRNKLWKLLRSKNYTGSMEDMIREFFGVSLGKTPFGGFCGENGISCNLFSRMT